MYNSIEHKDTPLPPINGMESKENEAKETAPEGLEKLVQMVTFLRDVDRLKHVERRSWLMDGTRRENSAEHSWHTALAALVLAPYAASPVNIDHVIRMLLIHDLVEIDAGDTFAYDQAGRQAAALREEEAARRLFSLLPENSQAEMLALWREFEAQATPEARFAKAMDRLMPVLHNFFTNGATWREYNITLEQVLDLNRSMEHGSPVLWNYVQGLLAQAVEDGNLAPARTQHDEQDTHGRA